ncbi:MAG: tyrosine-type recombinase/integrase [Steroidobacteraceae bacterium]|jgi:integrase
MASIQRIVSPLTKSVSYRAQVRVKGKPAQSETFPNIKEAKAWGASIESAIRENRNHPHLAGGKKTFAELVKLYRDAVGDLDSSKAVRKQHLDWWSEHFAGRTLAEITPAVIADARDALAAEKFTRGKVQQKKGVAIQPTEYARSGSTVNRYLATLSHMFTMAVKEWRLVPTNPVRDITKKKEARGRVRFLTDAEQNALLEACAKSDWPSLHTLVLLAVSTGARRSELINLKWDDIDLRVREPSTDPKTGEKLPGMGRAIVRETKNGEMRSLPLVGKTLEALRTLKLQGSAKSEWVFPQPSGFPGPHENFDGVWYDALTAAKLENFRFHDLRHTAASYLAAQGASLLEIADVLGHKTMSMVKRYSHLAQSHKVSVIEKMAKERGL